MTPTPTPSETRANEVVQRCEHVAIVPAWLGVPVTPGACAACIAVALATAEAAGWRAGRDTASAYCKEKAEGWLLLRKRSAPGDVPIVNAHHVEAHNLAGEIAHLTPPGAA